MEKAWQSSKQALKEQIALLIEVARTPGFPSLVECARILKRTWRVWLISTAAIFGLIRLIALIGGVTERWRNAREIRYEQAVASVTPDRLIARCGQPAENVTKQVYPILVRTMSYRRKGNEKLVFAFSRTAEEKSDWVFLSMKDENGTKSYDTPETKIAALPCLDSKE